MNDRVTPIVAAYTKNSPRAAVALNRLIAALITITSANWPMMTGRNHAVARLDMDALPWITQATPAVNSSQANIQANAWVRKLVDSAVVGRTPSCEGVAYRFWFGNIGSTLLSGAMS